VGAVTSVRRIQGGTGSSAVHGSGEGKGEQSQWLGGRCARRTVARCDDVRSWGVGWQVGRSKCEGGAETWVLARRSSAEEIVRLGTSPIGSCPRNLGSTVSGIMSPDTNKAERSS